MVPVPDVREQFNSVSRLRPGSGLTLRSSRRAAVAGPALPRLASRDAARRAAGTERPHAPERKNVGPTAQALSFEGAIQSWICRGCTFAFGWLHGWAHAEFRSA